MILSHAGGTLPWLISRVAPSLRGVDVPEGTKSYEEWMQDFRSFYFDLALSSSELVLSALLAAVPHDRIFYGMHPTTFFFFFRDLLICWIRVRLAICTCG